MRVVYFGTYERTYPRNAQVISCLRRAGVEVVEHHEPVWERAEHKWRAGIGAAARVAAAQLRLARRPLPRSDAVIVGYPGHADLPLARRMARGRPIVFNPLVSLLDTFVDDRQRFRPGSPAARALVRIDRRALRTADRVVADTDAQAAFLARLSGLPRDRFATCFVGAEERLFCPGWKPADPLTVLFVGKLIPLHGLETVLEAARRAPELRFRIVGTGQLAGLLARRTPNVEHVAWIDYSDLPREFHRAGCALGIFGTSEKARRVIPNKAYQALACGTPLVTADSPASRELLSDGESALLVAPGDPDALAVATRRLAADDDLRARIAADGLAAYRERASEHVLGRRWRAVIETLL